MSQGLQLLHFPHPGVKGAAHEDSTMDILNPEPKVLSPRAHHCHNCLAPGSCVNFRSLKDPAPVGLGLSLSDYRRSTLTPDVRFGPGGKLCSTLVSSEECVLS